MDPFNFPSDSFNDSARQFYLSVKEELINLGCKQANLDPALFYLRLYNPVKA
jgi:hypothetical protein